MSRLTDEARKIDTYFRSSSSPWRVLPDFIIIGAQKGGTTSLYNYLIEHPSIKSARRKEVHFFDRNFHKGLSWYRTFFPTALEKYYTERVLKREFITGEGSPEYLFYPHCAQKAWQTLPQVKIIALLRNPVERAYSQYRHNLGWGHIKDMSFQDALALEEEQTKEGKARAQVDEHYHDFAYQRASYLARGLYAEQLKKWMDLFPREQFLILRTEDFYSDPAAIYTETLRFLGVSSLEPKGLKKGYRIYNQSSESTPSKMDPATRERLSAYFAPHNAQLYELVGRDFGWH
ncbi:MAG TPA: sulfotransferase domain-containing protein [Ktedonobacteraceae bacterium]|nr:sulfotransferase domain-containing protein [Ktedonobacteraceae bacterium]